MKCGITEVLPGLADVFPPLPPFIYTSRVFSNDEWLISPGGLRANSISFVRIERGYAPHWGPLDPNDVMAETMTAAAAIAVAIVAAGRPRGTNASRRIGAENGEGGGYSRRTKTNVQNAHGRKTGRATYRNDTGSRGGVKGRAPTGQ